MKIVRMSQRIAFLLLCVCLFMIIGGRIMNDGLRQRVEWIPPEGQEEAFANMENPQEEIVYDDLPDIDIRSWEYVLINDLDYGNYLKNTFAPSTAEVDEEYLFDYRAAEQLTAFIEAARSVGYSVCINNSYISYNAQNTAFGNVVDSIMADGDYTYDEATELAKEKIEYPGTSEHQLGLAVDLADQKYDTLYTALANLNVLKWMKDHCAEYGFILRYPADKEEYTGRQYEPWHFRYVGVEAAEFMTEHNLCLEEFLKLY